MSPLKLEPGTSSLCPYACFIGERSITRAKYDGRHGPSLTLLNHQLYWKIPMKEKEIKYIRKKSNIIKIS